MTIRFFFAWFDLWIGAYWDRPNRRLYVLPIPCFGALFDFSHWPDEHPPTTLDERLLAECLDALNEEAQAKDDWRIPLEKCSAWFRLRADLRQRLTKAQR